KGLSGWPFPMVTQAWPQSVLFGQAGLIILRSGGLGEPRHGVAIVPRNPLRGTLLQFRKVPHPVRQIVERVGAAELDSNRPQLVGSGRSPWYLLSPGGIDPSGEIAAIALNMNTSEVHAVLLTAINGIGPAARGATRPVLPADLRRHLRKGS